jgi:hypothetical protein
MVAITILCVAIGIVTGTMIGHGILYEIAYAVLLGVLGALVGPPIAFVMNVLWALRP